MSEWYTYSKNNQNSNYIRNVQRQKIRRETNFIQNQRLIVENHESFKALTLKVG